MDIEKERPSILSELAKKMFSYFPFRRTSPAQEWSTKRPEEQPTTRLPQESTTEGRHWYSKLNFLTPRERTPTRPLWTSLRELNHDWNSMRPHEKSFYEKPTVSHKVEHPLVIQSGSPFGLENCLWVALGGIGVMVLMAIFMKLGKPVRGVRRQLSNNRPAPDVITVSLNPGDSNLDMGSLLRLGDTGPLNDPPPPYMECVGSSSSINKYTSEDPPPRYSATFENFKDSERQVHIRRQTDDVQNASIEGVRVELIAKTSTASHNSDSDVSKRTELVFDKGRIVERLSLDLNSHNTET